MDNADKKHFSCPKCGAGYRVVFDGKRYRCKKCQEAFTVPDETLPEPISKVKIGNKKSIKKGCLISLLLFVVFSLIVNQFSGNENKNSKEIAAKPQEPPKPSIPEVTDEMRAKRFNLFTDKLNLPETAGLITGYRGENNNINIIVSDIWYSSPRYEQERMINVLHTVFIKCSHEAGIPSLSDGTIYIYDQYGKQLGYWSSWSGAKLEK